MAQKYKEHIILTDKRSTISSHYELKVAPVLKNTYNEGTWCL